MSVWPPTLPCAQLIGLTDERKANVVRFAVDAGPDLVRRRNTLRKSDVSTGIELKGAERVIFDEFHDTTLLDGTLEFEWEDPRDDETHTFRFLSPVKWELAIPAEDPDDRVWRGTLNLEILDL
jgi:hypothetical protein